jgi:hypothetical protein
MGQKPLTISVISNEIGQACLYAMPSWGDQPPKELYLQAASHALRVLNKEGEIVGTAPATSALTLVNAKEYHVGQEIGGKIYTAEVNIFWVVPPEWVRPVEEVAAQ